MEDVNKIISRNISKYRKMAKLTQGELAERLSFSDKSISKWERGDAIPDVTVLMQMCEIFGITLNDIVREEVIVPKVEGVAQRNHLLISLMSVGAVWLVATFVFVMLLILRPELDRIWLSFVYAVPVSSIVLLVFSCIWGKWWYKFDSITLLLWTAMISLCITFNTIWNFLFVCIPLQCLTVLWAMLERNVRHKTLDKKDAIKKVKNNRQTVNVKSRKTTRYKEQSEDILLKKKDN